MGLDQLLLSVLDVARPVQITHFCQQHADLRVQRIRFAQQSLGVHELTPMDGSNRVGAGADELARPAQSLLARRVLAIELSSRPAFARIQVETDHFSTISRRLLPLPLFSEPTMRT